MSRKSPEAMQKGPEKAASSSRDRVEKGGRIAADVVFGALLLAFVINLLVREIIAVTDEPQHFWPVWLMIPLTIVGVGWGVARCHLRKESD